ncbi:hypothetical protein ACHWQZ_G009870 [Mnemiopsis leidyi]
MEDAVTPNDNQQLIMLHVNYKDDSELSHGRESALNATIPSYSSGHPKVKDMGEEHDLDEKLESESKASDVTLSSSDDDIQTDDSISNFDIASDISSNRSSTSLSEKYPLPGGKRKADDNSSKSSQFAHFN